MRERVAEDVFRSRWFGPKVRLRVDLHGVSVFGPGDERTLIRWEWIKETAVGEDAVFVRSEDTEIKLPAGAFGLDAESLSQRLEEARSIEKRPDVVGELAHRR